MMRLSRPLSVSSEPPAGDRIVRFIYLDAAGLSNPEHEPYVVIAGVIVHADKQWKVLGNHLSQMADEFAPPGQREDFAFHATELFSGGKRFPRDKYPKEWRWAVLDELVSIPEKFDLPIVFGCIPRSDVAEAKPLRNGTVVKPAVAGQIVTFIVAASLADRWMQMKADPDEIAAMIMENDDQSHAFIRLALRAISDPMWSRHLDPEYHNLKVTRIIHPIHFEEKTDSSSLQIADVCAFAIKRKLMGTPECDRFYAPIHRFIVARPKQMVEKLQAKELR